MRDSMKPLKSFSQDIILRNGTLALLRAIRPDDKQRLLAGFHRLTGKSIYFRFFSNKQKLTPKELKYFTEIDFEHHVAIVVTLLNQEENIVGVGRYVELEKRNNQKVAEVAFAIDDAYQNLGIGTILFETLVTIAQDKGISVLVADVLIENKNMLEIFKHSGFKLHSTFELGVEHIEFSIADQTFNRYYKT